MSEVKDVRAALENIHLRVFAEGQTTRDKIIAALISEGLAACDEYEDQVAEDDGTMPGFHEHVVYLRRRIHVFASILKKAGLP